MEPTRDAALLNRFALDPAMGEPVDLTHAAGRETNLFVFGEHGGFCFEWTAPGTYEVHVMIAPEGRGRWGFAAAQETLGIIAGLGARRLWARVRPDMPHLALFTRKAGFVEVDRRLLWPGPHEYRIFEKDLTCLQQ